MANQLQSELSMIRLAYVSKKKEFITDDDISKMASEAAVFNKKNNITGFLICSDVNFFQVLEGEEKAVLHLFNEKIYKDKRHFSIIKLQQDPILKRDYSKWSMKTIDLNDGKEDASDPLRSMIKILSNKVLEGNDITSADFKFVSSRNGLVTKSSQTIDKIVFFSDVVFFSAFSENLEPNLVIDLLNKYLKIVTSNIISNGGQVSKIMGDGVMAYFDPGLVDNVVKASAQILSDLQDVRYKAGNGKAEKVLYTGIGLAGGPVIEGNLGSDLKDDFTIIGDSVNLASRLESMTRSKKRALIFSKDIKDKLGSQWEIVEMGKHIIKGKEAPIELYSIQSQFTNKMHAGIELEWEIGNYLRKVCKEY
ncbi:MAG: BLUF domain-containing protein [Balneolales bacterium]